MKSLLNKNIAIKQRINIDLSEHAKQAGIISNMSDIVFLMCVMENPEKLEEYKSKQAIASEGGSKKTESLLDKSLRVLGYLDDGLLDYIRDNLEIFILERKFQDFVVRLVTNELPLSHEMLRTALREVFYKVFIGKLKHFSRMCDLMVLDKDDIRRQKGAILIQIKSLGIEVYEKVEHKDEFTFEELKQIYDLLCQISYFRRELLLVVEKIIKKKPPKELLSQVSDPDGELVYSGYDKGSKAILLNRHHVYNILRAIGKAIWLHKDYFFDLCTQEWFERLHRVAIFLAKRFHLKILRPREDIADDFGHIFIMYFLDEKSREKLIDFLKGPCLPKFKWNGRYFGFRYYIQWVRARLVSRSLGINF